MYTKKEIQELVRNNIDQVKISEFVAEGGWPNIDAVEVDVFDQKEGNDVTTVDLHILYEVYRPGCCFIPGVDQQMRLPKKVIIQNNQVKIA